MDKLTKIELSNEILKILSSNNFGRIEGYGRSLKLKDLSNEGVLIQGGLLGASFKVEDGLKLWNLASKSRMSSVKATDLYNIELQLMDLFERYANEN